MNQPTLPSIRVSLAEQTLRWQSANGERRQWAVSTAANGAGQQQGSGCTPLGRHYVRARIGEGQPINTVFIARRPSGEIYSEALGRQQPGRDWILTRILWLCGCEPGFNRLGQVDTMRRFIYIHGCPDHFPMGRPLSHGCVRMRNRELLELFDLSPVGTQVEIVK